jgi:hypothetical protein
MEAKGDLVEKRERGEGERAKIRIKGEKEKVDNVKKE